jgi:hypothetical protein
VSVKHLVPYQFHQTRDQINSLERIFSRRGFYEVPGSTHSTELEFLRAFLIKLLIRDLERIRPSYLIWRRKLYGAPRETLMYLVNLLHPTRTTLHTSWTLFGRCTGCNRSPQATAAVRTYVHTPEVDYQGGKEGRWLPKVLCERPRTLFP